MNAAQYSNEKAFDRSITNSQIQDHRAFGFPYYGIVPSTYFLVTICHICALIWSENSTWCSITMINDIDESMVILDIIDTK